MNDLKVINEHRPGSIFNYLKQYKKTSFYIKSVTAGIQIQEPSDVQLNIVIPPSSEIINQLEQMT